MRLFNKLEEAKKENKALREQLDALASGKKLARASQRPAGVGGGSGTRTASGASKISVCKRGQVKDAADNCRWVPRAVAARVLVDSMKASAAKIQLDLERKRRKDAEAGKRNLVKKLKAAKDTVMRPVPAKLNDVAQQGAPRIKLPTFKGDS